MKKEVSSSQKLRVVVIMIAETERAIARKAMRRNAMQPGYTHTQRGSSVMFDPFQSAFSHSPSLNVPWFSEARHRLFS